MSFANLPASCDVTLPLTLTFPPQSVSRLGWPAVHRFLSEVRDGGGVATLTPLRVLLLGDVGAGKTSVARALSYFSFFGRHAKECPLPDPGAPGRSVPGTPVPTDVLVDASESSGSSAKGPAKGAFRCTLWDLSGREVDGGGDLDVASPAPSASAPSGPLTVSRSLADAAPPSSSCTAMALAGVPACEAACFVFDVSRSVQLSIETVGRCDHVN